MTALYDDDLAYIHASGFSALATNAAREIIRRLRTAGCAVNHVIDAGCGAGVLTRALLDAGYRVTAIDPSAHLLEHARAAAPGAKFLQSSLYEMDLDTCEAIIALGEVLTYHSPGTDAEKRVSSFFERAAAALQPGGVLIFDIIETGEPALTGRNWSAGSDWAVLAETTEDQQSKTLTRAIETFRSIGGLYRRGSERHFVRAFERSWIVAELTAQGFSVESASAYGNWPLLPRRRAFFARRERRG